MAESCVHIFIHVDSVAAVSELRLPQLGMPPSDEMMTKYYIQKHEEHVDILINLYPRCLEPRVPF